jgi:hypothetical protein
LHTPVRTIAYRPNTFCLFLNVLGAVHSVTPRLKPIERRRSINIIGEFAGRQRMWNVLNTTVAYLVLSSFVKESCRVCVDSF